MALADIVRLEVVAASLVDGGLAGFTPVALPTQTPDPVLTLVTVGHLVGERESRVQYQSK